ncbi:phage late control D family protein [Rhodomicrobium lacus]|uniref:phage late control D family protein n=1 Tax=Rhodomicrobium lacus TaxID=2498452 RepID=UPI000F8C8A28|nr:late control D family protein [Rhodomicrobium lacus]
MAWTVAWAVHVDGIDVSSRMNAYLTEIEVHDKDGTASDTASLTFSDSDGALMLPKHGGRVVIYLSAAKAFEGTVDEVRSSGSKGGGRMLHVSAKGFDSRGKVKEPQSFHKDKATLRDFLGDAAKRAGLSGVTVDPSFASIQRDFWSADGETIIHLGRRLADELGGTFKIRGDKAVLAKRGSGTTPGGAALPTVTGTWGQNLISWDITPYQGRPRFTKAKARWFDRKSAKWKTKEVEIEAGDGAPEASNNVPYPKSDEKEAEGTAKGRKAESERESGGGSAEIDFDVMAQAEGTFVLVGARPGVDGTYRIAGVTHRLSKSGGATTSLELKQPQGDAGKDKRQRNRKAG